MGRRNGVSIERSPIGSGRYRIHLPTDRRLYEAENLNEAYRALQHYFGEHSVDLPADCPICRRLRKER